MPAKVKITSDGTLKGTDVTVNGEALWCDRVDFAIVAGEVARAHVSVILPAVDVEAELDGVILKEPTKATVRILLEHYGPGRLAEMVGAKLSEKEA